MGFKQADREGRGGYARIWSVEDKGNYSTAKVSTSRKRRDGEEYETDFQHGFVRLVGDAHEKAKALDISKKGVSIQIINCEVTINYDAEAKKSYTNYVIYSFETPNGEATAKSNKKSTAKTSKKKDSTPDEEQDDELPF